MRVAYVTVHDPLDVKSWSGSTYYIAKAFEAQSFDVDFFYPLTVRFKKYYRLKQLIYRKLFKLNHQVEREITVLKGYASQIQERLKKGKYDLVFCPGTTTVSYINTDLPIVFWTDSAFGGLVDRYPEQTRLSRETVRNGRIIEQKILNRCRLAIYSSDWAANIALRQYNADPTKVKVVPFGANIDQPPSDKEVIRCIKKRPKDACKLLFIGVDWQRKGGDIAVRVVKRLNERGLKTKLTVVGCSPPAKIDDPNVESLGFINKSTPEGRCKISELFAESNFFMLPTQAEAYGLVFCEAGAFGLPTIACRVGGVSTIVKDGVTGYLFADNAAIDDYCDKIIELMKNQNLYHEMCRDAREEYKNRLNWNVAGLSVKKLIEEHCR